MSVIVEKPVGTWLAHWVRTVLFCLACLGKCGTAFALPSGPPIISSHQPPQIKALLEHAWALESGTQGVDRDLEYAAALYCEAARHGNSEGHFRSGLIYMGVEGGLRNVMLAKSFLIYAQQLEHPLAEIELRKLEDQNPSNPIALTFPPCLSADYVYKPSRQSFDIDTYLGSQPKSKRQIAELVVNLAREYGISSSLALAIAAVESNFDPGAISPKQAMGVMQLIPATARRFNVRNPFDPEDNIRGGLAYLKWLSTFFNGNVELMVAAYNAGEGAVKRYGTVPPYPETQRYLERIRAMVGPGRPVRSTQELRRAERG